MNHRTTRKIALCCLFLLCAATLALAQVQVDVHLEKSGYLAGEPVVVIVDVRNVGDEAVGYSSCDGDVRLEVAGVERRVPPKMYFVIGRGAVSTTFHYFPQGRLHTSDTYLRSTISGLVNTS